MKKIYVTFIAIVAAFTAVSCSVGHALNPVKLYVADASPGVYGMGLSDIERIDLLHGGTDDRQAEPPQTATVTVSGKEYTGEYVANYDSPFYESGSYEYKCETDESTLIFRTDRKTGELVYYIIHANVKTTGPEKPYEECRDIADAALKQLGVSDTYAHEDYDEKPYVVMDDYHFVYCRTFDGVSTFDRIMISVDSVTGTVSRLARSNAHSLDGLRHISYDDEACDALVDGFTLQIAEKYAQKGLNCKFKTMAEYFTRLADGSYGVLYYVYFKLYGGDAEPDNYNEAVKLFVALE